MIPLPRSVAERSGEFRISRATPIVASESHRHVAKRIASELGIPEHGDRAHPAIRLVESDELAAAEYRIHVAPEAVTLEAAGTAGFVHAAATLGQLAKGRRIAAVEIHDWPRFEWRGLHLDVSRHFFDKERVLEYVEWMARYKLNVFHWHLTDDHGWRLEVPSRPALTSVGAWRGSAERRYGGFYTLDDVREVVARAGTLGIRVVPEIEMPGHVSAALAAHPELSCLGGPVEVATQWGPTENALCIGNPETRRFVEDVLAVVVELFPDPVIHVGGDECSTSAWGTCPRCRACMEQHGLEDVGDLHGVLLRDVADSLAARGKRIAGWGEIQEHVPSTDAIVMSWQGFAAAERAVLAGNDVVSCPMEHCFFDFKNSVDETGRDEVLTLEQVYAFDPAGFAATGPGRVLGGQANVWTEFLPEWSDVERHVFPRIAALAEALWCSPDRGDFASFEVRLAGA